MRCPHCSMPPPYDPFVCNTCGAHLATYLDEPLGPGTGVTAEALRAGVGRSGEGVGAGAGAIGTPAGSSAGGPLPGGQPGLHPTQPPGTGRPDNTGPFVLKLLFGLFVAMIVLVREPMTGLLFLGVLGFAVWRWPRASIFPFGIAIVGVAAGFSVLIELIDALDSPRRFSPTPTPQRLATSTVVADGAPPTLLPAARTATATVIAGENRVKLSRARARWLRGDNTTALAELDDALTLVPGLAESYNLRALVRVAAGDYQGAADDAERAVTAQPSSRVYRDTRGYAWLKLGRYAAAAEDYDRVLADARRDSYVASHLGRGVARTAQGRLVEARIDIETGLRLLPDVDPDPQLADLEIAASRALDPLAPRPGSPSPAASLAASPRERTP